MSFPSWSVRAKCATFRTAASLINQKKAYTHPPDSTIRIDATFGGSHHAKNAIRLDIYNPPSTPVSSTIKRSTGHSLPLIARRPCVMVLHGGGFIAGDGVMDGVWSRYLTQHLDAVVIAVSYRLAPTVPFPVPIEDCVSAYHYISLHAEDLGIDPRNIFLSGFSAGANLVFGTAFTLISPTTFNYPPSPAPPLLPPGIISFYPPLSLDITPGARSAKRHSLIRPDLALPNWLEDLVEAAYVRPAPDPLDPRLLVSDATSELLCGLPPVHLCVCEYDLYLAEGQRFAKRLEGLGREVACRVVRGEEHGWDQFSKEDKASVGEEYGEAVRLMKQWMTKGTPGQE